MKVLVRMYRRIFGKLFHKRSIIIISERRTNHIALSGPLQLGVFMVLISCIVWASYSTGKYMAAQNVLEERDETIKSVANSRIDTNFSYMVHAQPSAGAVSPLQGIPLTDPSYTLSAIHHDKLFARIAMLENRVRELKSTNAEIIQTVREKTHNKILTMEEIIRQTGLSPEALKEEAGRQRKDRRKEAGGTSRLPAPQGGPFVPSETAITSASIFTRELELRMDQLTLLSGIVASLPLGSPVKGGDLHSNFGRRVDPFTGRLAFHSGIDLSGPAGTRVTATGDGKVIAAGWDGAYGNAVDIDHGFDIVTRYGHLSSIGVTAGQSVKRGQPIGVQGSTGRSTGPHLHYEVRHHERPVNPSKFLSVESYVSKAE